MLAVTKVGKVLIWKNRHYIILVETPTHTVVHSIKVYMSVSVCLHESNDLKRTLQQTFAEIIRAIR